MTAAEVSLQIEQGKTFRYEFEWQDADSTPIDLSGYTAQMQLRSRKSDEDALLTLTDGNGITLEPGGATGVIRIKIGADDTATLTGSGYYDLELHLTGDPTEVEGIARGRFTLDTEVTRA